MAWPLSAVFSIRREKTPSNCPHFPARASPMPFDPKLVHPDQPPLSPDGELDWPDHLVALAQQLADDAAHLTASYPPSTAARLARPMAAPPRIAAMAVLSCAAAVAAAVLLFAG